MTEINAKLELFLEKKFREMEKTAKSDRHEQSNRLSDALNSNLEHTSRETERLEKKISELKNVYAMKWVEKAGWGIIIAVFSALGTALMNILLK